MSLKLLLQFSAALLPQNSRNFFHFLRLSWSYKSVFHPVAFSSSKHGIRSRVWVLTLWLKICNYGFGRLIWFVIPVIRSSRADHTNNAPVMIVLLHIPRLYLIFPLSSEIIKATGVVTKTAWAGAAYNLLLYMLASHVSNACLDGKIRVFLGDTTCCSLKMLLFLLVI